MSDSPGGANQVKLFAARGEYEPFQIVTNGSSGGQHIVNVAVSDLKGLWCKLKPTERSVKRFLVSDCELGSSCECRVPQFRHRRIAPAELASLELPLLDLFC